MYSATVRGPENLRYSILAVEVLFKFLKRSTYEIVHNIVADQANIERKTLIPTV
jgi:hypothetical protein